MSFLLLTFIKSKGEIRHIEGIIFLMLYIYYIFDCFILQQPNSLTRRREMAMKKFSPAGVVVS